MKRRMLIGLLFVLLITACAPAAATEAPSEMTEPSEDNIPDMETLGAAEQAAIEQLAESLGLEATEIIFLSSEETEFSDACLDVAIEGILCAQTVTPGRLITLEANGLQYAYHASDDGSQVRPASIALIWQREGGIAGFCDTLTVFRSGETVATNCKSQAEAITGSLASLTSAQEREQFNRWMAEFGEVALDDSDPAGVADRMKVSLKLTGAGDELPTQAEEQNLFGFAQDLYQDLTR